MKIVGIDGGGTKTIALLSDENLNVLKKVEGASTNYLSVGITQMKETLNIIISSLGLLGETDILSLGLAGVSRESDVEIIKTILKDLNIKNYIINNDAYVALYGAHVGDNGALLIAGTGSILYYKDAIDIKRAGGYGHLLGDKGSGYSIARKAISLALEANDGLSDYQELLEFTKAFYDLESIEEIIPKVYREFAKNDIAKFTKALIQEGIDIKGVKDILDDEAKALCSLCKILPMGSKIALSGSLLDNRNYFSELVKHKISQHYRIVEKVFEPAFGALLIAKKALSGKE